MGKSAPESDFNAVFRLRTRLAREDAGMTQAEVAAALDVDLDTYKKWENRATSALPKHLIYRFAVIVRAPLERLMAPPTKAELKFLRPKAARQA